MGPTPAVPGRTCTSEAGAANDPASPDVEGHAHRFRLGVDQPVYARLLRCSASVARAALHASVTRRAAPYGFRPQWVSIPPSRTKAIEADSRPSQGAFGGETVPEVWNRRVPRQCRRGRCGLVPEGSADPRVELVVRRLHDRTLKALPQARQPVANCLQSRDVSGRLTTLHGRRTPPPVPSCSAPVGLGRRP